MAHFDASRLEKFQGGLIGASLRLQEVETVGAIDQAWFDSPLEEASGEWLAPIMHGDFQGKLVGRVVSRNKADVLNRLLRPRCILGETGKTKSKRACKIKATVYDLLHLVSS